MSRRRRKAEISDDPDHLFDHGLYIPTRTIYIGAVGESEDGADEVNHRLASRVIKSIHILEGNKEPINVILNNPGGDEYHGLAIYDALRHTKCKVYISVFGHAMSMASIILQAGDKRLLSANATLMIHDGTIPMVNTDQEAKNGEKWADGYNYHPHTNEFTHKHYQGNIERMVESWFEDS